MTQIVRIRCPWGGTGVVGPGLTTFYISTSGTGLPAAVRTFFEAIKSSLPSSVTVTVPNSGDLIEDTTGGLAGTWSEPSGGGVTTGTFGTGFAEGVGASIAWHTGGMRFGRRVVGRTFIVPIGSTAFGTDGKLGSASVTQFQNAANALLAAQPTLRVLSKEKNPGDGQSSTILSALVLSNPSTLRSRRT